MKPIFATLMLAACIADAGPLQLRWTAELSDPKPYQAVLFQGESADLVATLKLYGRPVALEAGSTASLWWQTNGMGSAWWQGAATATTGGVVTATWTPAMDAGADLYRWHLGVANSASSTIYRAFGAFKMQPAPGAVPNALALPVRWIDFDLVAISNAPWATPADLAAATNGLLRAEADPLAYAPATNALRLATSALQPAATNGLLRAEADTLATVTARGGATTNAVTIGNRGTGDVGSKSLAQGEGAIASGQFSHAEGSSTTASGEGSHAEGYSTTASGQFSHAEGYFTIASKQFSHAEGYYTIASGDYSHADGYESEAAGIASHASGFKAYIPDSDRGAFAWQGTDGSYSESQYYSHGPGTFNLNPAGGLAGFWIGETTLDALLNERATWQGATDIAAAAVAGSGHLPAAATNGWTTSSHDGLVTAAQATNIASSVAGGEIYIDIPLSAWRAGGLAVKSNAVITNSVHGLPIAKSDNLIATVATLDPDWQTWAGVVLETRWVNPSLTSGNALIRMRVDTMTTNCVISQGSNTAISVPVVAQNTTTYRHTVTNAATMGYCSIQLYRSDDVAATLYLISSRIIPFK